MKYSDVWKSLMALEHSIPFVFMGRIAATIDNDMLKVIEISYLNRYHEIRVEFAIMALCDECCSVDLGNKELSKLNPKYFHEGYPVHLGGYIISGDTRDSIVSDIIRHIIPLFKEATDAEKALSRLIRIDELMEHNRLQWLSEVEMPDRRRIPFEIDRYWESHYFYLALKSHNYDFMCKSLKIRIDDYDQRIEYLNKQINETKVNRDNRYLIKSRGKLLDTVERWTDFLHHAEMHDSDYFDRIIKENEQNTWNNMPKQLLNI